ncbi:phosphotransferase [Bacillus sp. M6-12]|uniref:phosphotransferase family protein n=1 Tax=Bacillus sp. M6-12 TaxID=2054166 RepID=UPI000C783BBE|nr:phosphotransferase family protein [Bacillus sp. M6-12]PLS14892.1 phosphotransferase [Bacillus sp. M6-12]
MEHLLGHEWEIVPAGGATGEAFIALNDEQKLFLKRNSSPFLAVLSAEGIVPKLVWTKRMENGDVITAQHWLNGRELSQREMNGAQVAKLLRKIHQSKPLLNMLERLGKFPLMPENILDHLEKTIDQETRSLSTIQMALEFLHRNVSEIDCDEKVVCHCDVNHNNWLISNTDELYLIDWDGPMIADPAIDLGMLLYSYVPKEDWQPWLKRYGVNLDDHLEQRMKWHMISQTILSIQWHKTKNRFQEMNEWIQNLGSILK